MRMPNLEFLPPLTIGELIGIMRVSHHAHPSNAGGLDIAAY